MQINSEKEFMIKLLSEQVSIPSVKAEASAGAPFGVKTLEALEHFLAQAEADGFRTRRYDGYAGVIEFGPEDKAGIAGICHLDVVPEGEWTDAFSPRLENGRLIARGSSDDKGPAVAVYLAMKRLKDSAYETNFKIQLILGLDEESGSMCMKHYRERAELPVAAFTADADFPVIHAEKGMLAFRIKFSEKQGERGALRLIAAKAGSRSNVIPGKCDLTWQDASGEYTENVAGIMGHASMPELAKNAISLAMDQAAHKLAAASSVNTFVEFYNRLIGLSYSGEGMGIKGSDEMSGALTFNTGVLDFDGQQATLVCDVRYPVTHDGQVIIDQITEAVRSAGGQFELLSNSPPLYFPKDHPLVSSLEGVYQRLSGAKDEALAIGGGTYARSIPNTLAFGPGFPGDESLAHQNGEYVEIDKLYDSIRYYEEAFKALDKAFAK